MTDIKKDSFHGARIWLSAAVPEEATQEEAKRIREFVSLFARETFARGGTIIHGSHPKITDVLLKEAEAFKKEQGKKAPLLLAISRMFALDPEKPNETPDEVKDSDKTPAATWKGWEDLCAESVIVTPLGAKDLANEGKQRARSLALLRNAMAQQADMIVAIGGKVWQADPKQAGIPEEIEAARDYRLPLFLLGGMRGATAEYLQNHPELFNLCENGLSEQENQELGSLQDNSQLLQKVVNQIAILRSSGRTLGGPAIGFAPSRGSGQLESVTRGPNEENKRRRILCLDGGGIRGVFTASVLKAWETMTEKNITDHFDLIVGTSTGGILAIGLGMGLKPAELVKFYQDHGPNIFKGGEGIKEGWLQFKHWFAAKHDRENLRTAVELAYSKAPVKSEFLKDSTKRLAITAYESRNDFPVVLRTPHCKLGQLDKNRKRVDVAMATSAAPTYFDPTELDTMKAVDGGIWANSPTSIALAEAVELGWDLSNVSILSIGTTFTPNVLAEPLKIDKNTFQVLLKPLLGSLPAWVATRFFKPLTIQGIIGWLPNIANLLMKSQVQTAELVTRTLLGSDRYTRVDAATIEIPLDQTRYINQLIECGVDKAKEYLGRVERDFLSGEPVEGWK